MVKAKTIQIFLPDGNPRGVKIAEITNRTVQTIFIPRASVDFALTRDELNNVGVYFLVGESEDTGKPLVYVGETENCADRLRQHNKNKDFWQYALMIISQTKSFTKSCVKYLEWYCYQEAHKAGRFALENGTQPKEAHISESRAADLLDNFEDIKTLVSTLGYKIFDSAKQPTVKDILYCKNKDASGSGEYTEDGMVVFKGSRCRKTCVPSAHEWVINTRKDLLAKGVLQERENCLEFVSDYVFASPSSGAEIVLGRTANGWKEWKYKNGKTLDEVKRQG